jgi:hypothetical protein
MVRASFYTHSSFRYVQAQENEKGLILVFARRRVVGRRMYISMIRG